MNEDRRAMILQDVDTRLPTFAKMLPPTIRPAAFVAAAKTALVTVPGLLTCTRPSVVTALMKLAEAGLVPNGRDAVIVVGRAKKNGNWVNEAQAWFMAQGLLKLAYRSGKVASVVTRVVHENDDIEIAFGDDDSIVHKPDLKKPGAIIGAYAIARMKGEGSIREWMGRDEIDGIMMRSKSVTKDGEIKGPWATDYSEMARKTVLRRLLKALPLDSMPETGFAQDDDDDVEASSADSEMIEFGAQPMTAIEKQTEEEDPLAAFANTLALAENKTQVEELLVDELSRERTKEQVAELKKMAEARYNELV